MTKVKTCYQSVVIYTYIKMLFYGRIELYKATDVNNNGNSHKHIMCHFLYILNTNLRFKPKMCNVSNNLMMRAMSFE